MALTRYEKQKIHLRAYLLGANFHVALRAFDFAKKWHQGTRKDRKTPEFSHQVEIALYIITLKDVADMEKCIVLALLHDLLEDYYPDVTLEMLQDEFPGDIARECEYLSKIGKSYENYFNWLGYGREISLVKGADRVHNINSMKGAFSAKKQKAYAEEIGKWFLPMLKSARNVFPEQTQAYMNVEHMLRSQMNLVGGYDED